MNHKYTLFLSIYYLNINEFLRGYALGKPYRRAFIGVSIGEDPG